MTIINKGSKQDPYKKKQGILATSIESGVNTMDDYNEHLPFKKKAHNPNIISDKHRNKDQ